MKQKSSGTESFSLDGEPILEIKFAELELY